MTYAGKSDATLRHHLLAALDKQQGESLVTKQENNHKRKNGKVRVTFSMPAIEGCESLCLVGDFNEWNQTLHAMHRNDDGSWSLTVELEPEREYQFRYCGGEDLWYNDPAADAYVPNSYGSDNSVVRT